MRRFLIAAIAYLALCSSAFAQTITLLKDIDPGPGLPGDSILYLQDVYPGAAWQGRYYFSADDGANGYRPWVTDGTPAGTAPLLQSGPGGSNGSGLSPFVALDNTVLFRVENGFGNALWGTDGTAGGTALVKEIAPGNSTSSAFLGHGLSTALPFNGVLYFQADDGQNGIELWRSDGTPDGTYMLKDIR